MLRATDTTNFKAPEENTYPRIQQERWQPQMASPIKKQPLKIIVDSNALFVPLQFKIDIFTELEHLLKRNFELILISPVKQELEMLTQKSSPKTRKNAAFALTFAEKCTYVKVKEKKGEQIDDAIVRVANAWKAPVFTNDKLLKKKLRDISTSVIYVREKSRLEIDGLIS
jgi:rRNA-processing protein FCF1